MFIIKICVLILRFQIKTKIIHLWHWFNNLLTRIFRTQISIKNVLWVFFIIIFNLTVLWQSHHAFKIKQFYCKLRQYTKNYLSIVSVVTLYCLLVWFIFKNFWQNNCRALKKKVRLLSTNYNSLKFYYSNVLMQYEFVHASLNTNSLWKVLLACFANIRFLSTL